MTIVVKHGGGSHYMRPDNVYRTSVLTPMVGFQPQADVQGVLMEFTQGPPRATILSQGLGGLAAGPIERLGLRMKAWVARMRAQKFMAKAVEAGAVAPLMPQPSIPVAPASANAQQVSPQIQTQMQMLHRFGPHNNIEQAADTYAERRYFTYYRAG